MDTNLDFFRDRTVVVAMTKARILIKSDPETIENLGGFIGGLTLASTIVEDDPQRVSNAMRDFGGTVPAQQFAWCHRTFQNWMRLVDQIPRSGFKFQPGALDWVRSMQADFDRYSAMVKLAARAKTGEVVVENSLKKPARDHQVMMRSFVILAQHAGLFADCGLGKTYTIIDIADWFKKQHGAVKMLVVCPLSVIMGAWGPDIEEFSDLKWASLWHTRKHLRKAEKEAGLKISDIRQQERQKLLDDDDTDVWVVNFESLLNKPLEKMLTKKDFDIVAVDEASLIKNADSKTFKALFRVSAKARHRIAATGTPSPNGILDVWPLFHFIDRGETLDYWFTDYREEYCYFKQMGKERGKGRYEPKGGAIERLAPILTRRAINLRLEDCIDMPPYQEVDRYIDMTPEQARAYKSMKKHLFMELENERISVQNQLAKLMKLRQVTGGFFYAGEGDDRRVVPLKRNPKLDELERVLKELGHGRKAVIWSEFPMEIEAMLKRFESEYRPVAYYGGVPQKRKDANVERFQGDPDTRLMIANPKSCGFGVRFTAATASISFSIDHRYDTDYQKNRRVWRPPRHLPVTGIYLLCHGTVDLACRAAIRRKKNIEEALIPGAFDRRAYAAIINGDTP